MASHVRAISKHCCARRRYSSALLATILLPIRPLLDDKRSRLCSVQTRRSVRNLWRALEFEKRSPRNIALRIAHTMRVPETPPFAPYHGSCGGVLVLATDKPLSGTRLTDRTLVRRGTGGEDGRPCNGTGGRPHVDNRHRGWNSRPDRLLDTAACDSVL